MMNLLPRLAGLLIFGLATSLAAQTWPAKPVRLVVAYPPGGGLDFVARTVAQRLSEVVKQPIVVDNRTGASGTIGAQNVATSTPDGYTLLLASPAEVLVGPIAGQKIAYDPQQDLMPVSLIGETPLVIAAHPSVQAKTIQELLADVKKQPGKMSYGTPGGGSSMHFAGESLNALAGIELQHVPYRGAAPAVTDLLGGQVPLGIVGMPPTVQYAKSGKLRILAVTSARRSATMPNVPAMAEIPGFADYRFTNWMGLYAPAKTPQAVVDQIAAAFAAVVREPAIREKLIAGGVEPIANTPTEFASFLSSERITYSKVAKERGIRAEE